MRSVIEQQLNQIEQDHGVRVVYAVESGSRAWGFASVDSDFDVRFIYVHQKEAYLRLDLPRDVIELPIETIEDQIYDINGWDLYKALRLLRKSNPPLLEWLGSPIVYREETAWVEQLRQLAKDSFSLRSLGEHYVSMLTKQNRAYIEGKAMVQQKKYLYALRPLACCHYLLKHHQMPPTEFGRMLEQIDWPAEVMASVEALIERKKISGELGETPADAVLGGFIAEELAKVGPAIAQLEHRYISSDALNKLALQQVEPAVR